MEILRPIGQWCRLGIGFTLAFIVALVIGFLILSFLLTVINKLRLFTIGGLVFMIPTVTCFMISEDTFSQQWVLIPLLVALLAYSLFISYALDEIGFSIFWTIVEGLGVWIHGIIIISLLCFFFMIPLIFIANDSRR